MDRALSCPRWDGRHADANCTCRPVSAVHRENQPPLDLAPIEARIKERRAWTEGGSGAAHDTINADTEMLEAMVIEVKRTRLANTSLRAALGSRREMPVAK